VTVREIEFFGVSNILVARLTRKVEVFQIIYAGSYARDKLLYRVLVVGLIPILNGISV